MRLPERDMRRIAIKAHVAKARPSIRFAIELPATSLNSQIAAFKGTAHLMVKSFLLKGLKSCHLCNIPVG